MVCKKCGKYFPMCIIVDNKKRNLCSRKYCLDCVPFKSHKSFPKDKTIAKDYCQCLNCNKPLDKSYKKYCSVKCQQDYYYREYIKRWKNGEIDGTVGKMWIDVSGHIKRYLLKKYENKCSRCGWAEINPYTNTLPLEIEHIDSDATNNKEENLTERIVVRTKVMATEKKLGFQIEKSPIIQISSLYMICADSSVVEHLTFNHGAVGSIPSRRTIYRDVVQR